ncbi:MAG: hypothetical protein ACK5NG_00980, partial [Chthoniobacterales bacterium]
LSTLQPPIPKDVTPESFQDDLRKRVTKVLEEATEAKITLPENFYLGYNSYEHSPPSREAAPELARQLADVQQVVDLLIKNQVNVVSLVRETLPVESGKKANSNGLYTKNILDITVSGEQARVRLLFNEIIDMPRFIIVRALDFENSALVGPPKIQDQPNATAPANAVGGTTDSRESTKSQLNVILGRETVQLKIRLEILDLLFAQNVQPQN